MTTDTANPRAQYALSGAGPYALSWPYNAGELVVQGTVNGVTSPLVAGTDYTLSPASGPSGNLFLTGAWVTATGTLYIERATTLEQGWTGTFPGEKGIERALDRLTRHQQEVAPRVRGALFVTTAVPTVPLVPVNNTSIIWKDGRFQPGPSVIDLQAALDAVEQTQDDREQTGLDREAAGNSAASAAASSSEAGAASGRLVAASFSAMMAKFVTSAPGVGQVVPAVGDIITALDIGATYRVVASGEHFSTSRGVKLVSLVGHVAAFGADGVGDDTAPIQTAVSAGFKVVEFDGSKTYTVSSPIVVPANILIEANGATIATSANIKLIRFANGGGIRNARLRGPAAGVYNANQMGIACEGTNNHPSAPNFVNAPIVENCDIANFGSYGVFLAYTNGGSVRHNQIANVGYTGVGGVSCNDLDVNGNKISTVGPGTPGGDAYGVFVDRNDGLSETSDPRSYRCQIIGNTIGDVTASGGNGQGINTHAGVDFVIQGNTILNCQRGIFVTSSAISGAAALGPIRCLVDGNVVSGNSGYGILVGGAQVAGVLVQAADGCVVSNNTVLGYGVANDPIIGAVHVQYTQGTIISGNTVRNPRCNGIYLGTSNVGLSVAGNSITDPYDNTYSSPNCILVNGNNNTGCIGGNTFRFSNPALGTNVAVASIRISNGLTGLDLDLGRSAFIGLTAANLTFLPLTTAGVRYHGLASAVGQSTIAVANTGANGITDVVFAKRMPYIPTNISVTLRRPFNGGGKFPVLGIDTAVIPTAAGFRIYASPADGTTWTATGTLTFDYVAG